MLLKKVAAVRMRMQLVSAMPDDKKGAYEPEILHATEELQDTVAFFENIDRQAG